MTRSELVNQACSYIKETPYPNPNEFTRWFWKDNIAHAWCGAFVDFVVKQDLGCNWLDSCTKDKYVGGFGYVPSIVQWAKDNGYWSTKGQKGDLVIYNWSPENKGGLSHVGIVCDVTNNAVISVDGNTVNDKYDHDCVAKRTRSLKYVVGYVNLPYEEGTMPFKVGDYVYAKEDVKLYTTIEYKESKYTLKKGEKAYVRYTQGNNIALANPDTKEYFPSAWTKDFDKLTKDEPVTDYKELYEKELLINKDLKLQNEQLQEINKELEKRIFSAVEILTK